MEISYYVSVCERSYERRLCQGLVNGKKAGICKILAIKFENKTAINEVVRVFFSVLKEPLEKSPFSLTEKENRNKQIEKVNSLEFSVNPGGSRSIKLYPLKQAKSVGLLTKEINFNITCNQNLIHQSILAYRSPGWATNQRNFVESKGCINPYYQENLVGLNTQRIKGTGKIAKIQNERLAPQERMFSLQAALRGGDF